MSERSTGVISEKDLPIVDKIRKFFRDKKNLFQPQAIRGLKPGQLRELDAAAMAYFKENNLQNYYPSCVAMGVLLADIFNVSQESVQYFGSGGSKRAFLLPEEFGGDLRVVRCVISTLIPNDRKVNMVGSEAQLIQAITEDAGDKFTNQCYDLPFIWADIGEEVITIGEIPKIDRSLRKAIDYSRSINPANSGEGGIVWRTDPKTDSRKPYWVEYDLSHPQYCHFGRCWDRQSIIDVCLHALPNVKPLPEKMLSKLL